MNHTWGTDLRPTTAEIVHKKLSNSLKNKNPRSSLAHALKNKKTIRWGNKTDPFQSIERKLKVSKSILKTLTDLEWSFLIQTKGTGILMDYEDLVIKANEKKLITVLPVITCGLEKDWEIFERKRTTNPLKRIKHIRYLQKKGISCGVNGEPFIPGYHTTKDFEETMKVLKSNNIRSYNTYNLHFNEFVAKRLVTIDGVDIEKIWKYNESNKKWKVILSKLIDIAKKYDIILGCPDFVNTGWKRKEQTNTCCGISVPNPAFFTTHHWKILKQKKMSNEKIFEETWEGTGDPIMGMKIISGKKNKKFYTLGDIK